MLKKIIIKIFGRKLISFIRYKPFLVHGKYRRIIEDLEKFSKVNENNGGIDSYKSLILVRKYGHFLDKGLHRKDVKKGHSVDVVLTLKKNIIIAEKSYPHDETIKWAKDKLKIYEKLQIDGVISPLQEEREKESQIKFDDLFLLMRNRRSIRLFHNKLVEDTLIEKISATVNWASSSCNKQPIKLYATTNPEIAKLCIRCCKGGTGFGDFIPAFICFTGEMRGFIHPKEAYGPSIDVSLGAQNFLLAAETVGLGSTALSWAFKDDIEDQQLRKLLSIPETSQIIFNVVIGYPAKYAITPVRKNINHTLTIKNNEN